MTLTVAEREKGKKGDTGRLRRSGKIPAIVYGGEEPIAIAVDENEFSHKFRVISENIIISLDLGKQKIDVLVKDYQEDLLKNKIMHLDFYAIDKNRTLKTHVPLHLNGNAVGQKEGGILEHLLHEVEVECLPGNIPATITIDISNLAIHESIHVSDLPPMEGVRFCNPADQVICHIIVKAVIEEASATEAVEGAEVAAAEAAQDNQKTEE